MFSRLMISGWVAVFGVSVDTYCNSMAIASGNLNLFWTKGDKL